MGQCSTLPAEGSRPSSSISSRLDSLHARGPIYDEQRHRLRDESRRESLDFNKLIPNQQNFDPEISKEESKATGQMSKHGKEGPRPDPGVGAFPVPTDMTTPPRQSRDPEAIRAVCDSPIPMDTEQREEIPSVFLMPPPPPPENAVRTRCYKLNLDSEIVGLSSSQKQGLCLGPFTEPPPFLTYSSSEDSERDITPTAVAIQTAQIFRGITVGRDGTILTQNARATRSNRGKGTKRGEKSRQATKIDKAKDLVEETIATGKAPDSDDPASMVSLIVVGEYDDMKQLVRDGSKKLRDAAGLPDSHLAAINQLRVSEHPVSPPISPRKRVSPSLVTSQRNAALQSPEKIQATAPPTPQTAPPKLKSNPRDTRPGRREGAKVRLDSCNDFIDPRRPVGAVDGDWSHAWNIWNCGGVGAVSPFQPSSPTEQKNVFEGREASHSTNREGAIATRAD
ncbi:hypothetical protein ACA910_004948 [Epithemia clementina (nom. ined.)]